MTITQAVLGFAVVAGLLTLVPGMDTTIVLRSALVRGRVSAFATSAGVCLGLLLWGTAAAVGATALLAASEVAFRIVTWAGAAYMVYLGGSMILRSLRKRPAGPEGSAAAVHALPWWRSGATGLWTSLLNPKIGVFYIATIPQFLPANASALLMGIGLALVHVALTLLWFTLIIVGANAARRWLASDRSLSIIDRIAGAALIAFGARLAFGTR